MRTASIQELTLNATSRQQRLRRLVETSRCQVVDLPRFTDGEVPTFFGAFGFLIAIEAGVLHLHFGEIQSEGFAAPHVGTCAEVKAGHDGFGERYG